MTTPIATPGERLPIPGGVQLSVKMLQAGQQSVVVLGGIIDGFGEPNVDMATTWVQAFWSAFGPRVAGDVTCVGATLRDVSESEGAVFDVGAPTGGPGGSAQASAVAAACFLVKWGTAQGGRSGKGRSFIPGVGEGDVAAGGRTWDSDTNTRLQTGIGLYLNSSALETQLIQPAVLSFTKGAAYPITNGSLSPIVGLQRRRMRA